MFKGKDNDNRKVGEAMEAITLVKVGGSGDHHQYCHIDKMTRSVPDRAVIGVFDSLVWGLAGRVTRWRAPSDDGDDISIPTLLRVTEIEPLISVEVMATSHVISLSRMSKSTHRSHLPPLCS